MHEFIDFKCFREAQLSLFRPLTILIGPNASGKSNAIEGLQLLSAIAEGHRLHRITDLGRDGILELRGGLQGCPRYGTDYFTLGFSARTSFERRPVHFEYQVSVGAFPEPRIRSESLHYDGGKLLFETIEAASGGASGDIRVRYNNFARGGVKPQANVTATRSLLSQYEDFALKNNKRQAALRFVGSIRGHLRSSFVFDPRPTAMRRYERIGTDVLLKNGSNLSAVLFGLSQGSEPQRQALARLFDRIRRLPDEPYSGFEFITTQLGDVMFGMKESHSGTLSDARTLSDGTLRSLAVLTAIETVEPDSRVVVEEFDNGVHPSRVEDLVEAIHEASQRRRLSVLVTTHNPATLN